MFKISTCILFLEIKLEAMCTKVKFIFKKFILLLLFITSTGCFSFRESPVTLTIQDPTPVMEKKNLHMWIKIVTLPSFNHNMPNDKVNTLITYKLYKFIRELNQFETVNILYSPQSSLPENSIVLEFQFTKLEESHKFHPLFFPFGVTGMALSYSLVKSTSGFFLYDILGGPDTTNRIEYEGTLIVYNGKNQELDKIPFAIKKDFNSNLIYYSKEKEGNQYRKEWLLQIIQNILNKEIK